MKTSIIINPADAGTILKFLDPGEPHRGIPPSALAALGDLLAIARVSEDDGVLENHVGIHDPVTLVNPADASDWYRMEIVSPGEADVDVDRISICHPMSLAVLGRRRNVEVEWDTGHGVRHMRIAEVEKSGLVCG